MWLPGNCLKNNLYTLKYVNTCIFEVFFLAYFCNSKNIFGQLVNVHVGGIEWSFKTDVSWQITLPSLEILVNIANWSLGIWSSQKKNWSQNLQFLNISLGF